MKTNARLPDSRPRGRTLTQSRWWTRARFQRSLTVWAAGWALFGSPAGLWAHTYKQLPIIVNQLDGAALPDLEQRQKEMNDIFKQCEAHGVYIRVTITRTNLNQNPTNSLGAPLRTNGVVPSDAIADALDKIGLSNEVKTAGAKIWVVRELRSGTNTVNGSTVRGRPCTVCAQQRGVHGDARTWAHELGHAMGLPDLYGAGDTNNLMYGYRTYGTNNTPAGSSLTEEQCKIILTNWSQRTSVTAKNPDQTNEPPAKVSTHSLVPPPSTPPIQNTAADIDWVQLVFDHNSIRPSDNSLYVNLHINAVLTVPPPIFYRVWLDTDNNPGTGDPDGFDVAMDHVLSSTVDGTVTVMALPGGPTVTAEDPLAAQTIHRAVSGANLAAETPVGTWISSRVSLGLVGPLSALIRVKVTSEGGDFSDTVGPEFVSTLPPPEPVLTLDPIQTVPGGSVSAFGTGFGANTPYKLMFDDVTIIRSVTLPDGSFQTNFIAPNLNHGDFVVDAIDEEGGAAIAVLRVFAPGTTMVPGLDLFVTPPGATYQDFPPGNPIPPDFFGPGSDPFVGRIPLHGLPLDTQPPGLLGPADTIVRRLEPAPIGGSNPPPIIPIEIVALSLVSASPIPVTYNGGQNLEWWDVRVNLSSNAPQPLGAMIVSNGPCANEGGTFEAWLPVVPKLVFTRPDPPKSIVVDFGAGFGPQILFRTHDGHWAPHDPGFQIISPVNQPFDVDHDGDPNTPPVSLPGYPPQNFFPGLRAVHCQPLCSDPPVYLVRMTHEQAFLNAHGILPARAPGPDRDGDGIPDDADNCPEIANPDQADWDDNGIGDVCEAEAVSALQIRHGPNAGTGMLSWSHHSSCIRIRVSDDVNADTSRWAILTNPPATTNRQVEVAIPFDRPQRFFRLERLPFQ